MYDDSRRPGTPRYGDRWAQWNVTASGMPVAAVYTAADAALADSTAAVGAPGEPPFTRGIHKEMYRHRPWTIRPLAGFGNADDTNRRLKVLLAEGATGLNIVFDYVSNRGYDSDHPMAAGDVGQGGVAIDSVDDMAALLAGIPLDDISVSIVLSHPVAAGAMLAMYLVAAEERGYDWGQLSGTVQNDFLMETAVLTAPNILEPRFSFRLSMDVVEFCSRRVPRWNPISYAGYNYREAGADAPLELALVMAHVIATVAEMSRRGYAVDDYVGRLSAFFTAGSDLFEEVAKFRAARRLYHRLIADRFGAAVARSSMLRFHVQTSGSSLTAQQPLNNIARAALQALAGVLGGAQSIHVCAYDEAISIPSETAALTALRVQEILLHESGVARTADPLGGSYYVEKLTNDIERRCCEIIREIEAAGGLVAAVETGWVHGQLLDRAYRDAVAVSRSDRIVIGLNHGQRDDDVVLQPFEVPSVLSGQVERLRLTRQGRDDDATQGSIGRLGSAVTEGRNTMPYLIDAVRARATLGECCDVFRQLHGDWRQPLVP